MFAEDPSVYLADFGVPCTSGGHTFTGIFDTPDDTLNMAGVNVFSTMYALLCQSADVVAAGIKGGSTVTVNGTAYTVRETLLQDDGAFTQINLSK
jgi:hypothetical protein